MPRPARRRPNSQPGRPRYDLKTRIAAIIHLELPPMALEGIIVTRVPTAQQKSIAGIMKSAYSVACEMRTSSERFYRLVGKPRCGVRSAQRTDPICRVRFLAMLCLVVWASRATAPAQSPVALDIELYAGLTVTGAVSTVYSIEFV